MDIDSIFNNSNTIVYRGIWLSREQKETYGLRAWPQTATLGSLPSQVRVRGPAIPSNHEQGG